MKPYLFLLFVLFFSKSFAQNITTAEEQEAIKQAINTEAKYFYARNLEKWTNCYRQTPQTYWALVEKDRVSQKDGWDNINTFVANYFKENSKAVKCTFKRDNYNFRKVNPTYIWLTFDQTKTTNGKKEASKETRILELIKGEWKIVNATGFVTSFDKTAKTEESTKEKSKKEEGVKDKKEETTKTKKEESGKDKKSKDTKKAS
ncbi:hypothetical protein LV89_04370 [Arcicella aurantiaca]|uniref:SnoaL-like protein n=1 Tax=Arcicella aurantiaca TaxID=591202 RepID=A0A316DHT3_9BACT|nr:hypothetical protein [Arcicella aurantiaca]PWK17455.1 hypothetical protein LV89_04370 [Arcicella aurantiaca]